MVAILLEQAKLALLSRSILPLHLSHIFVENWTPYLFWFAKNLAGNFVSIKTTGNFAMQNTSQAPSLSQKWCWHWNRPTMLIGSMSKLAMNCAKTPALFARVHIYQKPRTEHYSGHCCNSVLPENPSKKPASNWLNNPALNFRQRNPTNYHRMSLLSPPTKGSGSEGLESKSH